MRVIVNCVSGGDAGDFVAGAKMARRLQSARGRKANCSNTLTQFHNRRKSSDKTMSWLWSEASLTSPTSWPPSTLPPSDWVFLRCDGPGSISFRLVVSWRMNDKRDADDTLSRLSQEATNQSSPEKSLAGDKSARAGRRKVAPNRTKAPRN